ncbi:MAG: UDP-N-acetylmuramoyl-L-alanyl-D-glutamate--2,6-diaminopimelate ligase [Micavibrio aeruginosavorus]|nr:UDP-N-acetylmuramoyl-L-alanyl-D-glutamate--2,6-diaminopimelate ligase [Micavibrio aeruginosavorus]
MSGLTQDSRAASAGWLFAALPGARSDGRDFIADAVRNGAAAILAPPGTVVPEAVALIEAEDTARAFALMAARFYPRQPEMVAAVTGTNGKTSTAHFTQQLWAASGLHSASLGTIGVRGKGVDRPGSMTTPEAVALHETLADLARAGVTHLAMEASSHGLAQRRLDGVNVRAAGFTNLTRDHLDYHADMEDYFSAKARLFEVVVQSGGVAVLNADVPEFVALEDICRMRDVQVQSYGLRGHDFRLLERTPLPHGQEIVIEVMGRRHKLVLPLVGAFQAMNALCALGLAIAGNEKTDVNGLALLEGAPGRLQMIPGAVDGTAVYVDYAHTPDALENILSALRPHTQGRLICLFGCGGDRDPGKRPIMGRIAATQADLAIITDDNPRSEKPETIRAAICEGAGRAAKEIAGRREAIGWAVSQMKPGDVLVLAGKGHEQGQIFADRTEPFDDAEEARIAMNQSKGAA